jgi:F0F1-type ATP synthase membrane subunit c/vacuolar-type H+-ATPase subunit K
MLPIFMNNQPDQTKASGLTLWVIWGALTLSILLYFVILQMTGHEEEPKVPPGPGFVQILTGAALVSLVSSFVIRKVVTLPLAEKLNDPANFAKILTSCIISWALAEAVAIYGLVLGMMGAPILTCGLFFIAGFGAMIRLTPNFVPFQGLITPPPKN